MGPQNDPKRNKLESVEKAPEMDVSEVLVTDTKINQKIKNTGNIEPQNDPKRDKAESVKKAPEMNS